MRGCLLAGFGDSRRHLLSLCQAMIHELLGIRDGTVLLDTPKVPEQYR